MENKAHILLINLQKLHTKARNWKRAKKKKKERGRNFINPAKSHDPFNSAEGKISTLIQWMEACDKHGEHAFRNSWSAIHRFRCCQQRSLSKAEMRLNVEHGIKTMNDQDCFPIRCEWLSVYDPINIASVYRAWWRGKISTLHGQSVSIDRLLFRGRNTNTPPQAGIVTCEYWWSHMCMPTLSPPSNQSNRDTCLKFWHSQVQYTMPHNGVRPINLRFRRRIWGSSHEWGERVRQRQIERERSKDGNAESPLWAIIPQGIPLSIKCHIQLNGSRLPIQQGLITLTSEVCANQELARGCNPLTPMYLGRKKGNGVNWSPTSSSPIMPPQGRTSPLSNQPLTDGWNR